MATPPEQDDQSEKVATPASVVDEARYSLQEIRLGVWKVILAKTIYRDFVKEVKNTLPFFWPLLRSIYTAAPGQLVTIFLWSAWHGIEFALQMHISSYLLRTVEDAVVTRHADVGAIVWSLVARFVLSILVGYVKWCDNSYIPFLEKQISTHLTIEVMHFKLDMDLPTSQGATTEQPPSGDDLWKAVKDILNFMAEGYRLTSMFFLIHHLSKSTGGTIFALLCVVRPFLAPYFRRQLWRRSFVAYIDNKQYQRMEGMEYFGEATYRQDIISHGLRDWIISQYRKAYQMLGNLSVAGPYEQFSRRYTPAWDIMIRLFGDLPFTYCAVQAVLHPTDFSIAAIAILQESATSLVWLLDSVGSSAEDFRAALGTIRRLDPSRYKNVLKDGTEPYPAIAGDDEKPRTGMEFELKNVTFAYVGNEDSNALEDVSLKIKSGDLIVIVGANGSGKSTLLRILARLYDPSSGETYIDGRPSSSYRLADLHRATALLSQDSGMYPVSIAENIGLGNPDSFDDRCMIEDAAYNGGASDFIQKLSDGYDTHFWPFNNAYHLNITEDTNHPLWKRFESIPKNKKISGGEEQRVVASRIFMRLKSGCIKFVAIDEPTSAMDADGEKQLFERLVAQQEGKTMVFVTHRFAHLTKLADQIICMKDGKIVETGKHEDLMAANGEYAKLYNIQANPFQEPQSSET